MEVNNTINSYKAHLLSNQLVQKFLSSTRLCDGNQSLSVREAKSFTGSIEELKSNNAVQETNHGEAINCHDELYNNETFIENQNTERGYETREVLSNQIFLVREEMLTYRGKRYSLNDIATKWKKDCRMWLWKSNKPKLKSRELREKLQNLKMQQ